MRPRQTQIAGAVLRNTHHQAYQQAVELLQQKTVAIKTTSPYGHLQLLKFHPSNCRQTALVYSSPP